MPQINRIRVNNVKYNFGTQYYDDFMMRFHCRNTIYDLANGGGKSLLMLLLLQNVIPNCTLDEKQPVEKLFRPGGGNTVIHSLIEWKLDATNNDGYKYMTTGFCARKAKDTEADGTEADGISGRFSAAEEAPAGRDNASVEYFNYCIFYREFGENDIKNLPLTKNGERITYNGLKQYLRELEHNDFHVSVKIFDRKGEYQSFISKYGLYESEWEIIRGINKTEGHVRTYFETNYKTSRKVVEDLLIEEIIQKSFHNKLAVGNDEGQMAQTLLDIKDTLARLSKKNAQITNYDKQMELLDAFSEYILGYRSLYEEKGNLRGQLLKLLMQCRQNLSGYRAQEEKQKDELLHLQEELLKQQRMIQTAEVLTEQASLAGMEELIAANEKKRAYFKEQEEHLKRQMEETESLVEYREYLQYQKLYDELLAAIAANGQTDEELTKQLYALAAVIVPQLVQKKNAAGEELQNAETQYRACQKEAAQAKADYQELLGGAAAAEQIAVHTAKEIEQAEKELGACMEKAGILVMEKAGEEYSACTQKIKEQEEQLLQTEGQLSQVEALLSKGRQQQASCRARIELLTEQLGQAETKKEQEQKEKQQLLQLKAVYGEQDTRRACRVVLDNHRRLEAECEQLTADCTQLTQFLENMKHGIFSAGGRHREKVKSYLSGRYGEDVKEGSEWLSGLSEDERKQVLAAFPYAEYAFIVENDFSRIKEDPVLADFGRSAYVIPVLSAQAAKAQLTAENEQYVVYARKDMAFLKDEKLRGREEKLAQEELAAAQEKLARLTDRKEIVWNDYVRIQELSKLEEEPAKKEFEALSVRLEELQKEAQRLQEEMEQEEALRKKGRERKAQVQEKLAQNRERYPYVQKCAKLAESLLVQYREKQEYTQRAADAKQEQLLKEQEMQAQEKAEQTALQRKNALAEEYDRLQSRLDKRYQAYISVEADGGQSAGIHVLQSAADGSAVAGLADADGHALSLEQLENRFAGVKKALDEKNADVHDKEELLRHYRAAMGKCSTAIARRHFTMEELAAKEAQGEAVPNPDDALRALEQEREQAVQQEKAAAEELEAQNALMNRLQGSIAHGKSQIEEKYGAFEAFDCDNPEQFIVQHKNYKDSIAGQIKELEKEQKRQTEKMQDFLVMEKDLSRIVAKAGIEVPEASETENADTMAGQPEDTDINVADFSGYETVQKEFEKLCALEVRKLEEFLKKKDKLTEELTACDAKELALEIKMSVHVPKDIEAVKQLKSRLSETNTLIALEKERVSKGISDMERIKDNFENRCVQICCNIKTELDRLPKLSSITMDNEVISIIGLSVPYAKESDYKERMAAYIDETVLMAESFDNTQERLKYIRNRLSWKRLFAVIVTDMNAIRVSLYKRERMKDQSRYLRYEEAVGSTGQSQGIYIQFLIAVIHYISSINAPADSAGVLGKTIFIDNPFGAAKDIYIWEPIFKLLKTNHVQLIVPARGATPAITGRFDVNYILGQKLVHNRQQTVVVDYYSRTKNEELEYTRMDYEQAVFDFTL